MMQQNFNRGTVVVGVLAFLLSVGAVVYAAGVNGNRIETNATQLRDLQAWQASHEEWSREQVVKIMSELAYIRASLDDLKKRP